jgi:peptidylprolyl isomerase
MRRRTFIATGLAAGAVVALKLPAFAQQAAVDPEKTLLLDLKQGQVTIEMFPEVAPKHVERIKTLTRQGFYDGTPFHRVIEGFMAQGGDPTGTGGGGSKLPDLPAEFSQRHFLRGICGMARSENPNSANSQFFIMFAPNPGLDGKYTIWGRVTKGMELVDQIKRGAGPNGSMVGPPDRIVRMRVMADAK